MKLNKITTSLVALVVAGMALGVAGPSVAQTPMPGMKHSTKMTSKSKTKKAVKEVKYKAQCGMIYSASDAKKYHYICPMDHKPLKKIMVAKKSK